MKNQICTRLNAIETGNFIFILNLNPSASALSLPFFMRKVSGAGTPFLLYRFACGEAALSTELCSGVLQCYHGDYI
jgi:hypothetical protein